MLGRRTSLTTGINTVAETPPELFYSYSHNDEELREKPEKHLSMLRRQSVILDWHDREVSAGDDWAGEIDSHLDSAKIILALVSSDFLASDYCYDIELKRALERHARGEARLIPVILRPADWTDGPFAKLQALPKNAKPITTWQNEDEAFLDVVKGIRRVAEALTPRSTATNQGVAAEQSSSPKTKWFLEISGVLDEFDKEVLDSIAEQLRSLSGDMSLSITNVESASVLLTIESSKVAYGKIQALYESKQLTALVGQEILHVGVNKPEEHGHAEFVPA